MYLCGNGMFVSKKPVMEHRNNRIIHSRDHEEYYGIVEIPSGRLAKVLQQNLGRCRSREQRKLRPTAPVNSCRLTPNRMKRLTRPSSKTTLSCDAAEMCHGDLELNKTKLPL
ncbi:uncharacterized protein LOC143215977 isoform X2 [Lasioglossum baleicum]|uniref:uncharacterized protein LOC143215977 isoform X2 n=1 Tax=Lasioglossum baleicum TaxID=434251 RepID=UPI003FCE9257